MVEPNDKSKSLIANKKEAIISLINKIDDEQLLDHIQELIYKSTNGYHAEDQIIRYLQEKYQVNISRGSSDENSGSFIFQNKPVSFRLERFYMDFTRFRLAFEIDENYHSGPAHDPSKELVRQFEYFKNRMSQNVVLLRYGFKSRRKDQPVDAFIEKRSQVIYLLIKELAYKGPIYARFKEKFEKGSRHLVCFYGYPGENRHVKEHTIFNDKTDTANFIDIDDTIKSTKEGKYRIFIFDYSIDKVNSVYKEDYSFGSENEQETKKVIKKKPV